MDLSEDELIATVARVVASEDPTVRVGPGDDAAVVRPATGELVLTTDLLVEGVHFERGSISARDLGAKAVTVNVSDVAAMGASPRYALVSLAVPGNIEASWVIELAGGMHEACLEYALALVGGDTNRADDVTISVAVVGEVAPGRAVTRAGARPGDAIVVTGELGAAAGGLALSRAEPTVAATALSEPWGRSLSRALARPVARVGEGHALASAGATAMMDLSDGIAIDLERLCRASAVGAELELASIPVAAALVSGSATLGVDAMALSLGGGEDYELLATMPSVAIERAATALRETFGVTLTRVGTIIDGGGVVGVDDAGRRSALASSGWDHFRTEER
jgi:thiamine-monophosphate kinase